MRISLDHFRARAVDRADLLVLSCAVVAAAVASAPAVDDLTPRVTAAGVWPSAPPPSDQFAITGLASEQTALRP